LATIRVLMPTFAAGALSPQDVVLGLLNEERATVAALADRMGERLPEAVWPRNAAHSALKGLDRGHWIRATNPGVERPQLIWEITATGQRRRRDWLCSPPALPLAMRDPLQAKLELVQPQDLPVLLWRIEEEEKSLNDRSRDAHKFLLDHGRGPKDPSWEAGLRNTQARELLLLVRGVYKYRAAVRERIEECLLVCPDRGAASFAGDLEGSTEDLSPRLIALGLVGQEPGTPPGVAERLGELFGATRFVKTGVQANLESLRDDGLVRIVGSPARRSVAIEDGTPEVEREDWDSERGRPTYEITADGAAYIRAWVCGCSSSPPGVRDVLRGKVQFVTPGELPALLQAIRAEEKLFSRLCTLAHARVLEEDPKRSKFTRSSRACNPPPWREVVRYIQTFQEANLWQMMSTRRRKLLEDLERLVLAFPAKQKTRLPNAKAS
jgi:DNA-binding PadR family transcriptional regulator